MKKFQAASELDGTAFDDEIRAVGLADGIVINRDHSLAIAFYTTPPDTSCYSEAERETLFSRLQRALNAFPENYDLEFRWSPVFREKDLAARFGQTPNPAGLVGEIIEEGKAVNLDALRNKDTRFYRLYVVLVRKSPLSDRERVRRTSQRLKELYAAQDAAVRPGWPARLGRIIESVTITQTRPNFLAQLGEEEFRQGCKELLLHAKSLESALEDANFGPQYCGSDGALEILFGYWNRGRYDEGLLPRPFDPTIQRPLSDYYAISPFDWDPRGKDVPRGVYFMDGLYHKILTLYTPPDEIGHPRWPHFEEILLYRGPRRLEVIAKAMTADRNKRLEFLRSEKGRVDRTIASETKAGKTVEDRLVRHHSELRLEIANLEGSLEKTWKAAIYFHIWAETLDELTTATTTMNELASSHSVQLVEETWGLKRYFRAAQPFWTQDPDRHRIFDYSTRQLTGLLPISGQPTNLLDSDPLSRKLPVGAVFPTVTASHYNIFLHSDRHVPNAHMAVCAGSRKGKSMIVQRLLFELSRYPLRAVIIDLGSSFGRFREAMDGTFIDFDLNTPENCLNPLFIADNRMPDQVELRSRLFILEQMLCDHRSGERFGKEEMPRIAEALIGCYRKHRNEEPILSDLLEIFRERGMGNWATRLHDWTGSSTKGQLFDGKNTVSLSKPITVFEFRKIKDDSELAPVLFHVATALVGQLATKYPDHIKVAICDEASQFLKLPVTADFFDQGIRTLAKNGVGMWVLSQNFSDFTKLEVTRDTFKINVPTWIFLDQGDPDICKEIAAARELSAAELEKLMGLKTVPGSYAEFLVVQKTSRGKQTGHCINIATPLCLAVTTSAPQDLAAIERLRAEMPFPDAMREFARLYPRGADARFVVEKTKGSV